MLAGGVASIAISKAAGLGVLLWVRSRLVLTPDTSLRDLALAYSIVLAIASVTSVLAGTISAWIGKRFAPPCGALASWACVLSIVGTSRSVASQGIPLSTALITCCIGFAPVFGALGALAIARRRVR